MKRSNLIRCLFSLGFVILFACQPQAPKQDDDTNNMQMVQDSCGCDFCGCDSCDSCECDSCGCDDCGCEVQESEPCCKPAPCESCPQAEPSCPDCPCETCPEPEPCCEPCGGCCDDCGCGCGCGCCNQTQQNVVEPVIAQPEVAADSSASESVALEE